MNENTWRVLQILNLRGQTVVLVTDDNPVHMEVKNIKLEALLPITLTLPRKAMLRLKYDPFFGFVETEIIAAREAVGETSTNHFGRKGARNVGGSGRPNLNRRTGRGRRTANSRSK